MRDHSQTNMLKKSIVNLFGRSRSTSTEATAEQQTSSSFGENNNCNRKSIISVTGNGVAAKSGAGASNAVRNIYRQPGSRQKSRSAPNSATYVTGNRKPSLAEWKRRQFARHAVWSGDYDQQSDDDDDTSGDSDDAWKFRSSFSGALPEPQYEVPAASPSPYGKSRPITMASVRRPRAVSLADITPPTNSIDDAGDEGDGSGISRMIPKRTATEIRPRTAQQRPLPNSCPTSYQHRSRGKAGSDKTSPSAVVSAQSNVRKQTSFKDNVDVFYYNDDDNKGARRTNKESDDVSDNVSGDVKGNVNVDVGNTNIFDASVKKSYSESDRKCCEDIRVLNTGEFNTTMAGGNATTP